VDRLENVERKDGTSDYLSEKAQGMSLDVAEFKANIVRLLSNGKTEEALEQLASFYHVSTPRIKVGLPKGHRKKTLACYTARDKTIAVLNSDTLMDPFTVLHEFYHHVRFRLRGHHRGTERNANEFARNFIQSYKLIAMRDALK
jgi:hypothetical protein